MSLVKILLFVWLSVFAATVGEAAPVTVTDILGREVTLPGPAHRIVLGQGRHIQVLSLLVSDPVALIVGWKEDMKRDPATLAAFRAQFPAIDHIESVGAAGDASFSVEKTISLDPDLVLLSRYVGEQDDETGNSRISKQLNEAGIPVIFVDFFAHPLTDTVPSLEILGKVLGAEEQTAKLIDLYQAHLDAIRAKTQNLAERPSLFMQVHATSDSCCFTPGKGVFNDFVEVAGGHNIAADILLGVAGKVSTEYVIAQDPDFFVATGGAHLRARGGLVVGPGVTPGEAEQSLSNVLQAPGIADLTAVRQGKAIGIWHLFNDTPLHIVMIELLAKEMHPALFADVHPEQTLSALNALSAVPFEGTFWVIHDGS